MSTFRFEKIFSPGSIAVVGASARPGSLGGAVLHNLRAGGFRGGLYPVNPRHAEVQGLACGRTIADLPAVPDLALICTPAGTVPGVIREAAAKGTGAAVVITAGLGQGPSSLAEEAKGTARAHGLRLVGPNCFGVLSPRAGLNASFAARGAARGHLALISQSGAVVAGLLEWSASRQLGWSGILSVGDQLDVDLADGLDHFATDPSTKAILLYVEAVQDATKFMSAARAAARAKPVMVLKAGRHESGVKAAATHTGALAGSDAVYDAALRRAGLVRVFDVDELFTAAEILGRSPPYRGDRLAILTNGGGLGVLAADRVADRHGVLATIDAATVAALDARLPVGWSRGNPIDIIGDADAARYAAALTALLDSDAIDAVLALNVPTALASAPDAAAAVIDVVRARQGHPKPVIAAWVGADPGTSEAFAAADIPSFGTEADAVHGFMHLSAHHRLQETLARTPPPADPGARREPNAARAVVQHAIDDRRTWLDPLEVQAVLEAYGIPIVRAVLARTAEDAVAAARPLLAEGGSVALKIVSPDIVHKSDVGGVALDVGSPEAVQVAAEGMLERARELRPEARLKGVLVQPMARRPRAREVLVGVADDPTFGPMIAFGAGGGRRRGDGRQGSRSAAAQPRGRGGSHR